MSIPYTAWKREERGRPIEYRAAATIECHQHMRPSIQQLYSMFEQLFRVTAHRVDSTLAELRVKLAISTALCSQRHSAQYRDVPLRGTQIRLDTFT